ncbi:MAG: universal stress protein [Acidimicrobiales bacterium]|jgi:nucleotide-binding universal stress UspA family protein
MTTTDDRPRSDHRVVVGIDGSPSSLEALAQATDQALRRGAVLEAVTTWEWPASYGWALQLPEGFDPAADAATMLDGALEPVRRDHPELEIRTLVVEGTPASVLVKASNGADLLVVGSRGHGEFAGMLLGSVSQHCMTNAHCSVLVVRDRT